MPVSHPSQGEHFHLRTLPTIKPGARSHKDLYTINRVEYESPSAASLVLGLISNDSDWINFFNQIKDTAIASSLRRTLATIIENSTIINAQAIWDRFRENFTDDCVSHLDTLGSSMNPPIV